MYQLSSKLHLDCFSCLTGIRYIQTWTINHDGEEEGVRHTALAITVRKKETDTHTDHHGEEGDRHTALTITVRKRVTDTQH